MSFTDIDIKPEYRSRLDNVIKDFYIPVLKEAVLYKRAVGFFSSTALVEMSAGICGLVKNGGKIQLIASPRLSAEDIDAINDGLRRRDDVIEEALIRALSEPMGAQETARLNLLSNLIASGVLEIKIAFLETENSVGMFHEKMGLMYDRENNIIAFSGSMNESFNAFRQNYEAVDVFKSWTTDEERVLTKQSAFNAMWNGIKSTISGIYNTIKGGFDKAVGYIKGLASAAFNWGKDIIMGIVNGIKSCIGAIGDAVSSVANKIRSFLHFSVPDEGPLTDFESWMPDFMNGLAKGIEKSKGVVAKAVEGVSRDMVISPNVIASSFAMEGASNVSYQNNANIVGAIREAFAGINVNNGDTVIPVYIGGTMLDEIIITAQQRANLRSGGR